MFKRLSLFIIIGLLILSGCATAARATPSSMQQAPAAPAEARSGAGVQNKSLGDFSSNSTGAAAPVSQPAVVDQTASDANRLVIRNANLTIVVDDPAQAMTAITQMMESMQGYVVTSNLYKTTASNGKEVPEANITVRVPAAKLDDARAQIKKLVKNPGQDVITENISGQDVTKEYTDLQSRQKNLEQAEAQLREIMGSATKTEDVLSVYNQLTQIREQIEVIKGQIKYYEESAAMSAIAVTIHAQASVQPLEIAGWQPVGVARDAAQTMINTMQFLASAAIWLVLYVLPVGLVIFIPLRLIWWLIRRSIKNRKVQAPIPPATPA